MFQKLAYIMNYLLECEENCKAKREEKNDIDFSRRYVDGAIRYNDEIIHYETIRERQFKKIYKMFVEISGWRQGHSVIDYGCGKGYMLYLLNKYGLFDKITGIELLPELCSVAENNIKKHDVMADIVCADAREYEQIDMFDVLFMFNPFPEKAMELVANRICESLQRSPRHIYIIYVNAVCNEILLERVPDLHNLGTINNMPRIGCKSSIYSNG